MRSRFEDVDQIFLEYHATLVLMTAEMGRETDLEAIAKPGVIQFDQSRPEFLPLKLAVDVMNPQSVAGLQDRWDQVAAAPLPPALALALDLTRLDPCLLSEP